MPGTTNTAVFHCIDCGDTVHQWASYPWCTPCAKRVAAEYAALDATSDSAGNEPIEPDCGV